MVGELARRAPGARDQLTPAIRAAAVEPSFCAGRAERALERADARVRRFRRQVTVAALAPRSQLEHGTLLGADAPERTPRAQSHPAVSGAVFFAVAQAISLSGHRKAPIQARAE